MRPEAIAAAVIGIVASSATHGEQFRTQSIRPVPMPPVKQEWRTQAASRDVVASFRHNDGSELAVICDTEEKRLTIALRLPGAKWNAGQGVDVIALPDSGQQPSPSYGVATAPTQVVLKFDTAFDVWTMAQAKDFFKLSVGDFARVFPAANFRAAVAPVLKACGG
jgi:hypothetical protein